MTWLIATLLPLGAWLFLLLFRGGFWRADQRLEAWPDTGPGAPLERPQPTLPKPGLPEPELPEIVIVVPARDEAEVIGRAINSLLEQDYPNPPLVVLVDDGSLDGTAEVARTAAGQNNERLCIVVGAPRPDGWAGKVWAMKQGVARAAELRPDARYILFTDADIDHHPTNLLELIAKAEADHLDLVSLLVRLATDNFWERFLIPPFVFFFAKLYPFAWVNDPTNATAAAAGGCMLARRSTLEKNGGLDALHDALIDDCALARVMKGGPSGAGRLWLGLGDKTHSIRGYDGLGGVWDMVARGAYTQLRYSPLLLAGTVFGMAMLYLAPPILLLATLFHSAALAGLNALTWALITVAAAPTYRLYGQNWRRALALPVAAAFYTAMTISSAWRYWRGRGGGWKGRTYSR